jgi:peptidyl-tRNA hydrolase
MYFIVRKSLEISAGKLAAQVGHAVTDLIIRGQGYILFPQKEFSKDRENYTEWLNSGGTKVVLEAEDKVYALIKTKLRDENVPFTTIIDEGRTEFKEPTETVLGIFPAKKEELKSIVGGLILYQDKYKTKCKKAETELKNFKENLNALEEIKKLIAKSRSR